MAKDLVFSVDRSGNLRQLWGFQLKGGIVPTVDKEIKKGNRCFCVIVDGRPILRGPAPVLDAMDVVINLKTGAHGLYGLVGPIKKEMK